MPVYYTIFILYMIIVNLSPSILSGLSEISGPELFSCHHVQKYENRNSPQAAGKSASNDRHSKLFAYYCSCGETIFQSFADLLKRYREPIINSFIMVEKCGHGGLYDSRLSNGPIESLNRKVKDLKRMSRSFRSFEHFRNCFLYATRSNPVLNGMADPVLVQYFENEPS